MSWLGDSLYHAAAMLWEMLWALVLGFGISASLQVLISKERMAKLLGGRGGKPILLAAGFGAASSSCSYAAAATMRTVFKKGASLVAALAFLIAATNLVIELGIVMWQILGWQFVAAEVAGAIVMIAVAAILTKLLLPRNLISKARKHPEEDPSHDHGGDSDRSTAGRIADAFVMDWSMLWKEILIGVLIAGFLMTLVPKEWWQALFLTDGPYALRLVENAIVGPIIAFASFVCSVGNVPLASLLWSSGATFGGVIAFIYGDLIVLPLVLIYAKYYGAKAALAMTGILFASMVVAGIVVDLLFTALGIVPQSRGSSAVESAQFSWNYTTWLDLAALLVAAALLGVHLRKSKPAHKHHHQPA
jgi:uncharacterized membrane protein YraQ (UPF0718 family)